MYVCSAECFDRRYIVTVGNLFDTFVCFVETLIKYETLFNNTYTFKDTLYVYRTKYKY